MNDDKKLEELIRKARLTEAQGLGAPGGREGDAGTGVNATGAGDFVRGIEEVRQAARTINTTRKIVTETGIGAWNLLKPLWQNPVSQWCWRQYRKLIDRYCYATDRDSGERKLSYGRLGVLALATYTAIAAVMPFLPGGSFVKAVAVDPAVDAAVMAKDAARMQFSYKEKETLYLNRESQTSIDRNEDTYMVKGSPSEVADATNSFYFVIKPGFLHSQWNLKQNGSLLYNTHTVAAAIPTGDVAKCEVTSYGSRHPLLLYLGAKPVLLEAKCESAKTAFSDAVTNAGAPVVQLAAAPAARPPAPG